MRAAIRDRLRTARICLLLAPLTGCGVSPPPALPAGEVASSPASLAAVPSASPQAPRRRFAAALHPPRMMDALRARLSPPERELRVSERPDGVRHVALEGQLQHATVAVRGPDGRVRTACVDNYAAAARALGVAVTE